MVTKEKMLTAVFRDRAAANRTYTWLLNRGYRADEINVLMTERTRANLNDDHEEGRIKAKTKTAEGLATGGVLGTALGASLAAIAAIAVPGLGWVAAGPIFVALAGGGAGALAGGAIGALIGAGVSESNASAYEEALRNGGVVLGVVPHNSEDAAEIERKFEDQEADNVVYA